MRELEKLSTEFKSHQYKQQMTFSDSEINSNAASLFSNVFLLRSFHSFSNKHIVEENVIIMGPKKNKIKEERNLRNQKNARCWTDVELDTYADVLAEKLFCSHFG